MSHSRWILVIAAIAAAASGCRTVIPPVTAPSAPSAPGRPTPVATAMATAEPSIAPTITHRDTPTATPTPAPAAALTGVVEAPDASLIGSGGNLVNDGGVILYRLQSVADQPIAGASVVLVDADGQPVSPERATTDAAGRFAFSRPVEADTPFFVQAEFSLAGEAYAFKTLAEPGAEPLEVDAASTLVAEKTRLLVKSGKLEAKGLEVAKLRALAARLREGLQAEALPFMAKRSPDIVAAFDQLLAEAPGLSAAAAELAAPAESWTVSTVLDADALVRTGVLEPGEGFSPDGAVFEVDMQGAVYFATPSAPVRIVKVAPGGEATTYATLSEDLVGPVRLAFSPAGVLHVMAVEKSSRAIVVASGEGETLERRVYEKLGNLGVNALGDRIVVDAAGDVFVTAPKKHVILKFPAAGTAPVVLAGTLDSAGHADGDTGLFDRPASLAMGPGGALFVADAGNNAIRRVSLSGRVSTVAGAPGESPARGGRGKFARFGAPMAIAVDRDGTIFFTDTVSKRLQRLTPAGSVFYVAAQFSAPGHLAVDGAGSIYVRDQHGQQEAVRKVSR